MMFKQRSWGFPLLRMAAVAIAFAATSAAHAAVGLYNTGVDDAGNVLAVGLVDSHYSVVGGGSAFAVNDAEGYAGYWLAPNAQSRWVTPLLSGGMAGSSSLTNYAFQTTFDMTGMELAGAAIAGRVTADNGITSIKLNNEVLSFTYGEPNSGVYGAFATFSLTQGFQAGLNTLTFGIVNGSGPTGLRVEMSNNFQVASVPEPNTYAMMLAGLMMMGSIARRRNKKQG